MTDIEPFRAYRPDMGRTGALAAACCPPREEIGPEQRDALRAHPTNAAHLLFDGAGAALREWLRDDRIYQDSARSLYVVEQEIPEGGVTHVRRGFLARVRITAEPADNEWLPLLRETHMNAQAAMALYPEGEGGPMEVLTKAVGRRPPLEADDPRGGKVRLWAVTDQHAISAVQGAMGPLPLTVKSGQAMLAAAAAYRDERIALGEAADEAAPVRFAMMLLIGETERNDRAPLAGLAYYSLRGI